MAASANATVASGGTQGDFVHFGIGFYLIHFNIKFRLWHCVGSV